MTASIKIKRCHGLGNVVCLLPVLDRLINCGNDVTVQTNQGWIEAFSTLRPGINWTCQELAQSFDLDSMTDGKEPSEHRVDEFGRMLGIQGPYPPLYIDIPEKWQAPFSQLTDCVIFAPEGGHASRCWPEQQARALKSQLPKDKLVLVGQSGQPNDIPCDFDTRSTLDLTELLGLISVAKAVVSMDSAVLHIAAGLQKPTVALFGGVEPRFRIRENQPVVVLQADMDCCPCNKNETCDGTFPCIAAASAADVAKALKTAQSATGRIIERIPVPAAVTT